jgi:geranylgeranyl diphosphate synthase type II
MIETNKEQLRATFSGSLPISSGVERHLRDSLLHVLNTPGSLARPQIIVEMSAAYGQTEQQGEDLATALEYFHTASLLFDDLPCMDNATERRGVACLHLVYGEASAILAALALINRAYALMWKAVANCPHDIQSRSLAYIEHHLGIEGLLSGQSLDLRYATLPHDLLTTEKIARGKTVSLIRLTLVLPAMLSGAPESELLLLERIALYWGLSYQILDDLKDVIQTSIDSGKTTARDAMLGRPNVALVLGAAAALHRLSRLIHLGDRACQKLLKTRDGLTVLTRLGDDLQRETARMASRVHTTPSQRTT